MKNLVFKIFITLLIAVGISGCYTIVWTPKDEFPTAQNSDYEDYGYYPSPYYGEYYQYYHHPWWYSVSPPAQSYVRDSNKPDQNLRNEMGGRGNTGRNGVLQTGLPSVGSTPSTGSTEPSKNSSGNRVETTNTENNTSRSSNSNNSNNNTVRNNNGNRNSNDGRK